MKLANFSREHPALAYFITTFTISWLGAFIVVAPNLFSGQPIPKLDGILMFPLMILGPPAASIILTKMNEGKPGLRNLIIRMARWKVSFIWYVLSIAIPPLLILVTLIFLRHFLSTAYTPNFFALGFVFGIPAGLFEEIGWTGYAFPKMRAKYSFTMASILLGFFWGIWHLPVIDFLGAASPHGKYFIPFAISFILVLAPIRIIICWIYSKTNSIFLAQVLHIVSTGSLVVLGPGMVTPAQESLWYMAYAALLWTTVFIFFTLKKSGSATKERNNKIIWLEKSKGENRS